MARKGKTNKKNWLEQTSIFIFKYLVLPIITGVIAWAITKHIGDKKINDLDENIKSLKSTVLSLENKIQIQKDSLYNNTEYIKSLEIKLHNSANTGVIVGGNVSGGTITGSQNN